MGPADLITTAEAQQMLGVNRSWLTRLVQSGRLSPATKLPGRTGAYLFERSEIERYRAERAA